MNPEPPGLAVHTDAPLRPGAHDEFDSAADASRLVGTVGALLEAGGRTTVGLLGPWGSGKTGVLNLAMAKWREAGVTVVETEVWEASLAGPGAASLSLHSSIAVQLSPDGKVKKVLSKGSSGVSSVLKAVNPGGLGDPLASAVAWLTDVRRASDAALAKADGPVVVVVDDVDRLTAEAVSDLFAALMASTRGGQDARDPKQAVCFVLALDAAEVAHLLQEHLRVRSGTDYLEKLINIPVTLSLPSPDVLARRTAKLVRDVLVSVDMLVEPIYFDWRFRRLVHGHLTTPRDMKRYVNLVAVTAASARDAELDPEQFLTLSAVAVFDPELHATLRLQRPLLSPGVATDSEVKAAAQALAAFGNSEPARAISRRRFLDALIPDLESLMRRGQRADADRERPTAFSNPEYFDRYFQLSAKVEDVPDRDVEAAWARFVSGGDLNAEFAPLLEQNSDRTWWKLLRHLRASVTDIGSLTVALERAQCHYATAERVGFVVDLPAVAAAVVGSVSASREGPSDEDILALLTEPAFLARLVFSAERRDRKSWEEPVKGRLEQMLKATPSVVVRELFLNPDRDIVRVAAVLLLDPTPVEVGFELRRMFQDAQPGDEDIRALLGWVLFASGYQELDAADDEQQLGWWCARRDRLAGFVDLAAVRAGLRTCGIVEVNRGDAEFANWLVRSEEAGEGRPAEG